MPVSSVSPYSPFQRFATGLSIRPSSPGRASQLPAGPVNKRLAIREVGGLALGLRRALDALGGLTDLRRSGARVRAAAAPLGDALAISTSTSTTKLRSAEEVNVTDTSFGPRDPTFSGPSSAAVAISGIYDGDQGDDRLTFRANSSGVVGVTPVSLEVLDGQGATIEDISFGLGYRPGDAITLQNGLEISLGSGTVAAGDSFDLDVSISVGTSVDPNRAFADSELSPSELTALGLDFDLGSRSEVVELKRSKLRDALRRDAQSLADLLAGGENGGLIGHLENAFDTIAKTVGDGLGRRARGLVVDLRG